LPERFIRPSQHCLDPLPGPYRPIERKIAPQLTQPLLVRRTVEPPGELQRFLGILRPGERQQPGDRLELLVNPVVGFLMGLSLTFVEVL